MVVHISSPHRYHSRGDSLMKERKYDATYMFGKTTVHVISPGSVSNDEKEQILNELHLAGWSIIDRLEKLQQAKKESKERLSG